VPAQSGYINPISQFELTSNLHRTSLLH